MWVCKPTRGSIAGKRLTDGDYGSENFSGGREAGRVPGTRAHSRASVVVIFGASGDLTKRKLLPALFHLEQAGLLPEEFAHGRRGAPRSRPGVRGGYEGGHYCSSAASTRATAKLDEFIGKIGYHAMNFDDDQGYDALKKLLEQYDQRLRHAAAIGFSILRLRRNISPTSSTVWARTGWRSLKSGHVRVIIEKPFGHDLESARELNDDVNKVFSERPDFPHRSLSGQRDGSEHVGLPFCQRHF